MLAAPTTSSELVVFDAFQSLDRETLLKEVIGLANAQVDGPRHILFGVNPGGVDGKKIVGITDSVVTELKRAHRSVSSLVEPSLELAFIFDRIDGKLVGALEIDGCDYGPYFLAQDLCADMHRGACWQRDGRDLVTIDRNELLNGHAPVHKDEPPVVVPKEVSLSLGFNDDPDCEYMEVDVPDSSNPPFAAEESAAGDTKKSATFMQSLKETVSTMSTQVLKKTKSNDPSTGEPDDAGKEIAEAAKKHYFYEECAVKVDLCVRNDGDVDIKDLAIEFGAPRVSGFDVADRIYTSPFDKRSANAAAKVSYPEVEHQKDAIFVRSTVASLPANESKQLFGTSLRLAIGPKALGKKLAFQYVLRNSDGRRLADGRLKIRFGKKRIKVGTSAHQSGSEQLANA